MNTCSKKAFIITVHLKRIWDLGIGKTKGEGGTTRTLNKIKDELKQDCISLFMCAVAIKHFTVIEQLQSILSPFLAALNATCSQTGHKALP